MFKMLSDLFGLSRQIDQASEQNAKVQSHLDDLLKKVKQSADLIAIREAAMSRLQEALETQRENSSLVLKQARVDIERLEEALASSRDELRTAKEITIPGLIASHEVLVSRWEAETKIAVMRGSLAEHNPRSDE